MGHRRFRDERYVFDIQKGSWVLNVNGAANDLGYSSSASTDWSYARETEGFRGSRETHSLHHILDYDRIGSSTNVHLERVTFPVKKYRSLPWTKRGSGIHARTDDFAYWLPFPSYPPSEGLGLPQTETVPALPASCSSCPCRSACASWLRVSFEQPGVRLCACAKAEDVMRTRPWEEVG